jgi:diguanylate cyclase (GGDEF)-like protein/PAS domain S-box-containing protein
MLLEDVISNFPFVTTDAVAIGYQPSKADDWEFVWVNDAFCHLFNAEHLDALGRHPNTIHHPDYIEDFLEHEAEMVADGRTFMSISSRCRCDDGEEFWASISLFIVSDQASTGRHCVFNIRDINDLKDREQAAELALIENEHLLFEVEATQTRLLSAIETTTDPFAIYDVRDNLVIWNPGYASAYTGDPDGLSKGMKLEEVLHLSATNGFILEARGRVDAWVAETLASWNSAALPEFRLSMVEGEFKVVLTRTKNGDRVVLQLDISEFLEHQRQLKIYAADLEVSNEEYSHQALHDELTGLGNRRFLSLKLEDLCVSRQNSGGDIAALHVDLDRFKQVNDTMGHVAGDYVLEKFADCLRAVCGRDDIVARTGGDEFVMLVPCAPGSDRPNKVAADVVEMASKPFFFEGKRCNVGASVGIARTPLIAPDELLTSSDIALYKAKSAGRGSVGVFDSTDLIALQSAKNLADEIWSGILNEEFVAVFLPEIDSLTGAVVALEVLVRWQHPTRGVLLPDEFMQAAQDANLVAQIDAMILRQATTMATAVCADTDIRPMLSFNVSKARMYDDRLLNDVQSVTYDGALTFELTESIVQDEETIEIHRNLEGLRSAGVQLVVDDFGSGNVSILALRRLSPDRIKIDQRLVEPVCQSSSARQLVESIVSAARILKIGVSADGVETEDQVFALRQMGCDRLQGPFFSQPMTIEAAMCLLQSDQPLQPAASA